MRTQPSERKEKPKVNKHRHGSFDKRVEWDDNVDYTPPSEAYINSALGSTLGHQYSVSRFDRAGGAE